MGIELLNEPFAGDFYHDPLIMVPTSGIDADAVNLGPAYDVIAESVRNSSNPDVLIFFAGVTWDDLGV